MDLIEKIRFLMKKANIRTTAELSRKSNIPYSTLKSIFDGNVNNITLSTSRKLCDLFRITLDELFDDNITLTDFRYTKHNEINIEGLNETDIEEINRFVEFVKNKRNETDSDKKK